MDLGQGEIRIAMADAADRLREAARDPAPVSGLSHTFYRYPARFSPRFVRTAIELFTQPGDLVLDPFVGGGTTLVEAMALGRNGVGIDISSLATFVSRVKTTLLTEDEILALAEWIGRAKDAINMHRPCPEEQAWGEGQDYKRHLRRRSTWRLRKAIEQSLESAKHLPCPEVEQFARCVVLRTAQWALDSRKRLPKLFEFRSQLNENFNEMIAGVRELRAQISATGIHPAAICVNRSAVGLEDEPALNGLSAPRLVLTSPPYPGIHVLYHRWQVDGRKETPAPFWIARMLDGSGASYYTMGDRKERELKTYYDTLAASFRSVADICDEQSVIVQMVAFGAIEWQLPRYLEVMQDAGFRECQLAGCTDTPDGRLWRMVPNRRWHADQKGATPGSREVVLIHRLSGKPTRLPLRSRTDSPRLRLAR